MAVRLHLKYGLVAEGDRLESSPDTILVTEPTVGTVLRSKGSLYTVVTARARSGGRPHEASALVAEAIRREYYYDESAGIPACLDKAIRSANRRLRHQREGQGLARGSLGAVVAIVRGRELYVATIGEGEAYLVRQARLLTLPEEERGEGLPSPDDPHVDVWRGDLEAGDSLLLVSRNLVRVVGTEELKNAVVTLHPQSAVEHLHHLFVAAGGEGSDAVLAVEATEAPAARSERRTMLARPGPAADEDEPSSSRVPAGVAAAASAALSLLEDVRDAIVGAFWGVWDRIADRFAPRRRSRYRRVSSLGNRREAQRRALFAVLGMVGAVVLVGSFAWLIGGALANTGRGNGAGTGGPADRIFASVRDRLDEVEENDLITANEGRALALLREAWAETARAEEAGASDEQLAGVRREVRAGLDRIYRAHEADTAPVVSWSEVAERANVTDLEVGPDGAAYTIDERTSSVLRVDVAGGSAAPILRAGDGPAEGMAEPWLLEAGGRDLLVLDRAGVLWRWRPSEGNDGDLDDIPVSEAEWGEDIVDIGTYQPTPGSSLYNFYVVDPSEQQILVYAPAADGNSFPTSPVGRLGQATDLSNVRQMAIDGDIYLLTVDALTRYASGRPTDFSLATPPDDRDTRPAHRWGTVAMIGAAQAGSVYVWDFRHRRIVEFGKSDGQYVQQWVAPDEERDFVNMRGMAVTQPDDGPPTLLWATPVALWSTPLVAPESGEASPSPSGTTGSPSASP